jgi:DNA-binding transcriptional MerR regulator
VTKRLPAPASAYDDADGTARTHAAPASQENARQSYTISDLAAEFAITPRTIRFYESRGLIAPERAGTQRRYSKRDRARLILILRGRNLGFTVEDVGDYLALYDADPGQIAQTQLLLDKVTAAIADLEKKRSDIDAALSDLHELAARCETHLKGT